jgi:hypothetical protein
MPKNWRVLGAHHGRILRWFLSTERKKKEIECLTKIKSMNGSLDDIMSFLLEEKLASLEAIKAIKNAPNESKELRELIEALRVAEKLQLVEYQWVFLPKEYATIMLVSDRQTKEFGFST